MADGKPVVLHGLKHDTEFRTGDLVKLVPANERFGARFYITDTDSETYSVTLRLASYEQLLASGHLEVLKVDAHGNRMLVPASPKQ